MAPYHCLMFDSGPRTGHAGREDGEAVIRRDGLWRYHTSIRGDLGIGRSSADREQEVRGSIVYLLIETIVYVVHISGECDGRKSMRCRHCNDDIYQTWEICHGEASDDTSHRMAEERHLTWTRRFGQMLVLFEHMTDAVGEI
jgi:hypothetical protein